MKCAFTFNGAHYIAPSKKEARRFLKFFSCKYTRPYRFKTNWRIKHIEVAPSYCQMMIVGRDNVSFKSF